MRRPTELNQRLRDAATREETLLELGEWVRETCLMFGTSVPTAYQVAGIFVGGLAGDVPLDMIMARRYGRK